MMPRIFYIAMMMAIIDTLHYFHIADMLIIILFTPARDTILLHATLAYYV